MSDVTAKLAQSTQIPVEVVGKVLTSLANLAYAESHSGFVLPGFGEFRVVRGSDTEAVNPFTGKTVVFHAPQEIQFTVNTSAEESFIAAKDMSGTTTPTKTDTLEALPEVRLLPNNLDLQGANINGDTVTEAVCKLGGEPDWIQTPEFPFFCGRTMVFYGQLDSLDENYCVGDRGRLFVFTCQKCSSSKSILQF